MNYCLVSLMFTHKWVALLVLFAIVSADFGIHEKGPDRASAYYENENVHAHADFGVGKPSYGANVNGNAGDLSSSLGFEYNPNHGSSVGASFRKPVGAGAINGAIHTNPGAGPSYHASFETPLGESGWTGSGSVNHHPGGRPMFGFNIGRRF